MRPALDTPFELCTFSSVYVRRVATGPLPNSPLKNFDVIENSYATWRFLYACDCTALCDRGKHLAIPPNVTHSYFQ